jgi:DNA-binding NarL/FixJ family response regulator
MTRVFIADTRTEERFALSLMMRDLHLEVVGEAADWATTFREVRASQAELLLVDWELLPSPPSTALDGLRKICRADLRIVLISKLEARQQAALSSGADTFISKAEASHRMAEQFVAAAASIQSQVAPDSIDFFSLIGRRSREASADTALSTATGTDRHGEAEATNA